MGFGAECGNSRAARADGTHAWVWDHRFEQLARMERDWAAHTTALGTADAAKWVNRQEYCSTQPRATISMGISTGPSGRSVTESAARCLGPSPIVKRETLEGLLVSFYVILDFGFEVPLTTTKGFRKNDFHDFSFFVRGNPNVFSPQTKPCDSTAQ